jgi:O-acetyl-ADP-ribose deacetylase (regulator of RNase III)
VEEVAMEYLNGRVEVIEADITCLEVDAIVNAANRTLLGGGGVDGAIHRAAGPQLLEETKTLGGARTGEARITGGYGLPARFVIHAVGPVWHGGNANEAGLLADCYRNSLTLAVENGCSTIAFPAISTGVYSFPVERATEIALSEIKVFLEKDETLQKVVCCCYGRRDYEIYVRKAEEAFT